MEEIIDILDEKTGNRIGKTIEKSIAHKKGIWHGAIHILIVNKTRTKTLLQKRCIQKKLYPNMWDIAVGGHIASGEEDILSAKRELEEELGLDSNNHKLEYIDRIKEKFNNNGIISNEYVSVFIIYENIDIKTIKLQKEEVSEVEWITKEELNKLIEQNKIVPHNEEFNLLNSILN